MNMLFVSPHPDDVEVALGGFVHSAVTRGVAVDLAVCAGPGDLKMVHSGEVATFKTRVAEQQEAWGVLGGNDVLWLGVAPASKFDTVPQADFVTAFDDMFGRYDEVYIPLPSYNADHRIVFETAMAAFRPLKIKNTALYAYEQSFGNVVGPQLNSSNFGQCYRVLAKEDIDKKLEAVSQHKTQFVSNPDTIYGEAGIVALAKLRGLEIGCEYAEKVFLLRKID